MWESFRWWRSLKRNQSLREWIEDTYTMGEIRRMAVESTDCDLHETWDMFGDLTLDQWQREKDAWAGVVRRLYRRYGTDIWLLCLPESKTRGPEGEAFVEIGVDKLVRLELSTQVSDPKMFEEFMVRNAFKLIAKLILQDKGTDPKNRA